MAFMSYEHASSSFAWKASSFKNPADYLVELTSDDRGEMLVAVEALERSGRLSPVHALTKTDFRFDGLRKKLEHGYAAVDIFTCSPTMQPADVVGFISARLRSQTVTTVEVNRGIRPLVRAGRPG